MASRIIPLQIILERLGCTDPAKGAFFSWDEIKDWPPGALDELVASKLLQPAQPMNVIECDGCEENCIMPVTVYPVQEDKPGKAFITCDKRDDIGRVPVDFRRMEQCFTSGKLIAQAVASLLELRQLPVQSAIEKQWILGTLKGNKFNYPITLKIDDTVMLLFAGHAVPLLDLLFIKENTFILDKVALSRLVNNPANNSETESPADRCKRLIARIGEEKAKGTRAFLSVVAKEEGISESRLKQIRAKNKNSKNSSLVDLLGQASSKKSKPKE